MTSQTETLISAIRANPGITRSELVDLRTEDGFRIANITARITDARNVLAKDGETIVCEEGKRLKGHRATTYRILPI